MECHRGVPDVPFTRWDYDVPEPGLPEPVSSCSIVTFEVFDNVSVLYPGVCRRLLGPAAGISDIRHLGVVDVAFIALPRFPESGRQYTVTQHRIAKLLTDTNASTRPRVTHVQCSSSFRGQPMITDTDLQALAPFMPCLASLDARHCGGAVTDSGLLAIATHCPHLTRLQVHYCAKRVTDVGVVAIASNCRRLTWLDVADCDVTDGGLRMLAPLCASLRCLDLTPCERVTDTGLEAIGKHCTRLERLHIPYAGAGVTDVGIRSVVIGCADPAVLDVSGIRCVTDATLHTVAEHCRNLTELQVRRNTTLTFDALDVVARRCTRLRRICLDLYLLGSLKVCAKLMSLHPHVDCVARIGSGRCCR
jgi:hypothetical protein